MVKTYIVDHVAGIEELRNSEVNVVRGRNPSAVLGLEPIGVVEGELLSTIWAVIVQPARAALPVLVSEDIVTKGGRVVDNSTSSKALVGLSRVIRSGQRVPAERRCYLVIGRGFKRAVTTFRIVQSPLPDVVLACDLVRRNAGIRRPIKDFDNAGGIRRRDGSFVPVLFSKLSNNARVAIRTEARDSHSPLGPRASTRARA